jgi:hypothetical protein
MYIFGVGVTIHTELRPQHRIDKDFDIRIFSLRSLAIVGTSFGRIKFLENFGHNKL